MFPRIAVALAATLTFARATGIHNQEGFLFGGLHHIGHVAEHVVSSVPVVHTRIEPYDHHPVYGFSYTVHDGHTGDSKHQFETRHGDSVRGEYSLHEPDGTRRVVHYSSEPHTGFNAVVHRTPSYHH